MNTAGRWLTRLVISLCFFSGLSALAGGAELMVWPNGAPWLPPLTVLEHTPFTSFLVPGVLLFVFVGTPNLTAAVGLLLRRRWAGLVSVAAGVALAGWIVGEMLLLRAPSVVEVFFLVIGGVTASAAEWARRVRLRSAMT